MFFFFKFDNIIKFWKTKGQLSIWKDLRYPLGFGFKKCSKLGCNGVKIDLTHFIQFDGIVKTKT